MGVVSLAAEAAYLLLFVEIGNWSLELGALGGFVREDYTHRISIWYQSHSTVRSKHESFHARVCTSTAGPGIRMIFARTHNNSVLHTAEMRGSRHSPSQTPWLPSALS